MKYNEKFTTSDLLYLAMQLADDKYDGHITLLKFTAGWKGMFGTINLYNGDYETVLNLKNYATLKQLLYHILSEQQFFSE